ncbi:DUF222 domain-containing protein [Agromyces sp. CFH 90414]|uniref:DUF222 domain-containing protein n=1 Tax=Agromyces agglutinans TaxID=2662258 RepID=A0A6I2FCU0_9MICO|nr:HNH endonuclease signature motif containing protein [Agromyces agglutinans]MRG60306.1 DUF222 domain-containing protein [Agromyces agglutinans]
MTEALAALHLAAAAWRELVSEWAGALIRSVGDSSARERTDATGAGVDLGAGLGAGLGVELGADLGAMSDAGLVRVVEAGARLTRVLEGVQARCAAELASRSRGGDGADLARAQGYSSPERLLAQVTGRRYSDAARLVAVGEATAGRASFTGEVLPPRHPQLAAALAAGTVCVDAADLIRRFLDQVAPRVDRAESEQAEAFLVARAPEVGSDGLVRLIKALEARLDPDGVRPREAELRARRGLKIWEDGHGMINLRGAFDPATGAPIKLAIETLVGAELHRARDARPGFGRSARSAPSAELGAATGPGGSTTDALLTEDRTIEQLNADALADIARVSLTAKHAPPALRGVTVVARVTGEALAGGQGHATIDGIDQPVSVATARELAMSAGIAPLLLGHGGEPLDLGRSARLFSPAQKLALVDRDGGCAWPACTRPPSHTQAHHIAWWGRDHGATDLGNGIMLCAHHHHRVHDDGWVIRIRDGRTWFVPPAHLDPDQHPRAGNAAPHQTLDREPTFAPEPAGGPEPAGWREPVVAAPHDSADHAAA